MTKHSMGETRHTDKQPSSIFPLSPGRPEMKGRRSINGSAADGLKEAMAKSNRSVNRLPKIVLPRNGVVSRPERSTRR